MRSTRWMGGDRLICALLARLKANRHANLIFFEFIEQERNSILKEYKIGERLIHGIGTEHDKSDRRLLLIGAEALTQDNAIRAAIKWWEDLLFEIERDADAMLKNSLAEHREAKPRQGLKRRTK